MMKCSDSEADRNVSGGQRHLPLKFSFATGGFLIDVCIIWPIIFCACSFSLFFAIHPNSRDRVNGFRQIPTLSQTGMLAPESLFFTYGLHFEAAVLAVLFTLLYAHFQNKIDTIEAKKEPLLNTPPSEEDGLVSGRRSDPVSISCCDGWTFCCCCCCMPQRTREANIPFLTFWNKALWILGLVCSFLMSMVGTITLDVQTDIHGTVAFFMFLTAILHMILYYFTIAQTMGYTSTQLLVHRVCLFVCLPFNIVMLAAIGLMFNTCNNDPCMKSAVDLIVALEYTTTIALLVYVYRFRDDLKDINLIAITAGHVKISAVVPTDSAYEPPAVITTQPTGEGATEAEEDHTPGILNLMI